MKNLASVMTGMIVVLALAIPTFAQHSGPMKVTVPFNFMVENDRLKAGDYTIERVANGRLRIRNNDGSVSTIFSGNSCTGDGHPGASTLHFPPLRRRIFPGEDMDARSGDGMGVAPREIGSGARKEEGRTGRKRNDHGPLRHGRRDIVLERTSEGRCPRSCALRDLGCRRHSRFVRLQTTHSFS